MAMSRRGTGVLLVLLGLVLGGLINVHTRSSAEPPAEAATEGGDVPEARDSPAVVELKKIHGELKAINTLLHSGTVKVIVVLNPDEP
jgi:hypothetical protein